MMSADAFVCTRTGKRAKVGTVQTMKRVEDVLWRRNGETGSCEVIFDLSEMKIH